MTCVPHSTPSTAQHSAGVIKVPLLQGSAFHADSALQHKAMESQDLFFAVGLFALVVFAVMVSQKLRLYRERRREAVLSRAEQELGKEEAAVPLAASGSGGA